MCATFWQTPASRGVKTVHYGNAGSLFIDLLSSGQMYKRMTTNALIKLRAVNSNMMNMEGLLKFE
jgi:hypothetical protein